MNKPNPTLTSGAVLFITALLALTLMGCKGEPQGHTMNGVKMDGMDSAAQTDHTNHAVANLGTSHTLQAGTATVQIQNAWVRPTVTGQKATGAFMRIEASQDLTLTGVASPAAGLAEVHEMQMENGVMKMRALEKGLPLPAGNAVELKPGGYHIMLMDLKTPIENGTEVELNLSLIDAQGTAHSQTIRLPAAAAK